MYFRNDIDPDNLEHEQSAGFLRDKLLQVCLWDIASNTGNEYKTHSLHLRQIVNKNAKKTHSVNGP